MMLDHIKTNFSYTSYLKVRWSSPLTLAGMECGVYLIHIFQDQLQTNYSFKGVTGWLLDCGLNHPNCIHI